MTSTVCNLQLTHLAYGIVILHFADLRSNKQEPPKKRKALPMLPFITLLRQRMYMRRMHKIVVSDVSYLPHEEYVGNLKKVEKSGF